MRRGFRALYPFSHQAADVKIVWLRKKGSWMKVLCLQGSPRREGNTATVLAWVEDEFATMGHEVDHIDVVDLNIEGCREDMSCQRVPDKPACAVHDDADLVFEKMLGSDLIVFASPLFCWGFSAQMKALLDRSICLCKTSDSAAPRFLLEGKRMALVCTAAGPKDGNMDIIPEVLSRYAQYQRCEPVGDLLVPRCTEPSELDERVKDEARKFARTVA
jgi:multimeric flavodoxin WrbA